MSLIEITEVRKSFGDNEVLKGIDIDVEPGEVIAIIGKSGSGKSTLLRCINGLENIDSGSISVDGAQLLPDDVHLKALRLKVGMIFQQFNLFPHLTAGANVMLAQTVVKKAPKGDAGLLKPRSRLKTLHLVFSPSIRGNNILRCIYFNRSR